MPRKRTTTAAEPAPEWPDVIGATENRPTPALDDLKNQITDTIAAMTDDEIKAEFAALGCPATLDDPDLDEVPHPHEPVVPVASLPDPEPVPLRTFREWIADRTHRGGFDLLDCRLPTDKVRVEVELERRLFLAWEAAREGLT